ncbi:MAG: hypothetical protein OEV49_07595 [candidate division Zixibacteria bacterium]|nr:hypothetical protein [candidate division Zixibacteria bacterium]MDH4035496.1 hypothetical protein [candidate division Zixibacteria bacterium]
MTNDGNGKKEKPLSRWIQSEAGKEALDLVLSQTQKQTERLKKARQIDPKKFDKIITH